MVGGRCLHLLCAGSGGPERPVHKGHALNVEQVAQRLWCPWDQKALTT
jgi:hypothetical protein